MDKKQTISFVASSFLVGVVLTGCGGGGNGISSESTSITIVDPYISGATMFWDKNKNGVKDVGEPESTASDDSGKATFNVAIPSGETLIMNTKGIHNGVAYTGTLSAKYSSSGVVSPLTTLEEKGYSKAEIVTLLKDAGITITEADITADPMANISTEKTSATENDITKIRANIAVNAFLSLQGFNATKPTLEANKAQLTQTVALIKSSITPTLIGTSNAEYVVKSAVAMANFVAKNPTQLADFVSDTGGKRTTAITGLVSNLATNGSASQVKLTENESGGYSISSIEGYGVSYGVSYTGNLNMTAQEVVNALTSKPFLDIEYEKSVSDTHELIQYSGNVKGTLFNNHYVGYYNNGVNFYIDFSFNWSTVNDDVQKWDIEIQPFSMSDDVKMQIVDKTIYRKKYGTDNEECTILSTRKVDKILEVPVDAIEVKQFCTNGQGDNYAVGDGFKRDGYNSTYTGISDFLAHLQNRIGWSDLMLTANNKIKFKSTGELVDNGTWKIEDDILKIKHWNESWFKIGSDGLVLTNYLGDTSFAYIGITESQAKQIASKMGLQTW